MNQGKIFIQACAKMLVIGVKELTPVGPFWKMGDAFYNAWIEGLKATQDQLKDPERVKQLQEVASCTPEQVREIVAEYLNSANGANLATNLRREVLDIAGFIPGQIRQQTRYTLEQARRRGTAAHLALPVTRQAGTRDRDQFYASLLPRMRSQFQAGMALPHGNKSWCLQELLGVGGFGEVWLMQHNFTKELRAVKFCQEQVSQELLLREADTLYKLQKSLPQLPEIVHCYDVQLEADPFWLSFEHVPGGTLESLIRAQGPQSWRQVMRFFTPLLRVLAKLHA
ncbi:hypothetical protein TI04_08325, partial [Achromatium sp. WMS2]